MDSAFLEWIIGQAGIGGLAAMSLYLLNRWHLDSLRREREYAETLRTDRAEIIRVVSETTRAVTELRNAVETLIHERTRSTRPAD